MNHKTFFWFFLPTALAMLLFIALPLTSIVSQSLHTPHDKVLLTIETCDPFGCKSSTSVDHEATQKLKEEKPLGKLVGLKIYFDRGHLAINEVAEFWKNKTSMSDFFSSLKNLPFYRAMGFTLAFTFVVTPLVILFGFIIALAVNAVNRHLKGVLVFFSLLPFIVTPLVGSLILFWMIDSRGIIGTALQFIFENPELSLKASTGLTWITLIVYGIWHAAPFAFIVFYAGLQTVPKETLESAMIDGASRFQQVVHVIVPHLSPLVAFVALMQLMDNFRVFEPIIGFNAEAHATSLSWIIYNDLGGETRLLSSAATSSVLTIIGVSILLMPVLVRTWREFKPSN
ncbi:MAG: sugar ABC transporter permease [Candidatus Marinimicrobia bacterium]|nr:sugar ABC transporter permease [Candidatus Neomarinimicrobiota bacterium]|tara:strand:+ start:2501 stop:3526 length:1026 start_codon:yes stop_codon:yes gene_type:complete